MFRILPMSRIEEEVKILHRPLHISQMVIGRSPQEICDRLLRHVFHPHIERLQGQRIIFVRTGGKSQVAISLTEIGFKLYCRLEFLLRLCELLLFDQRLAQTLMKRRIVGTAREKPAISRLALIIFLGNHVEISEIALQRNICRSQLLARLQFGNRLVVLTVRRQHAPQLDTRVSLLGMRRHKFFQLRFSFRSGASFSPACNSAIASSYLPSAASTRPSWIRASACSGCAATSFFSSASASGTRCPRM